MKIEKVLKIKRVYFFKMEKRLDSDADHEDAAKSLIP
jgi:hypothetical protein